VSAQLTEVEIDRIRAPLEQGWTLPPSAYTSPEVFCEETREIFYKEWICVAREEQIPEPGDYRAVQVVEQPLIVVRQTDGSIRAMSAICPHRGMPVVGSHGRAQHFYCPYHLWKFALDGALVSAPLMDGVDELPKDCRLPAVQVETWQGFIFANLDSDAPSLRERLSGLDEQVGAYDMGGMRIAGSVDYDCPWNWKLLIENFMEAYHHIGPHNVSLQGIYPAKQSYVSGSVAHGWSVLHMPGIESHGEDSLLPPRPGLSETQANQSLASVIMPTFCWINTPAIAFWYELKPSGHDEMKLTIHALAPVEMLEGDTDGVAGQMLLEVIRGIHEEDIPVNQGPWKGMHAPLTTQGRLSHLEESIWQINQWWAERMTASE
jgi:phenylpropionate dioxygenase-like ring-hydroxylating dioxygenase large terminal subunit